ncbi:amylo-alpha-1,6-glucosidase [Acidicapsa ligni]|uniref:amylo-alpha-1,6-glucosidase n=1 Tax=Acidicapsa ligni TaxID=542300 RepID=UPI0021E0089E|nr:hypothetical protein [Acidicapsa ligni]
MSNINSPRALALLASLFVAATAAQAQSLAPIPAFPLETKGLVIDRPVQPVQPFTVAGERGVLLGQQNGSFESWIMPVKLLSGFTIEAQIEGYPVPIAVNPQAAQIEVRPDHTTITYTHTGFTIRQIMFSPNTPDPEQGKHPSTGPVVLFQIDAIHPVDFTFRFNPELRWMWPRRSDGTPSPDWVPATPARSATASAPAKSADGFYILELDYPDMAGAITIPGAQPGILAPYQERPQEHPLELKLHYDPKRDGDKYFPLLMAVGTNAESSTVAALGHALEHLNAAIPADYAAHLASYQKLQSESTSITTPDTALNQAFQWGVVSIEQLRAREYTTGDRALVAGYYSSGDSARPGFGWFFGRDSLYTLYAINGFGDFALTRDELNFLTARQRTDGKIMHEYSQTAADPSVNWKSFSYMYAAADATPLYLMAMRDYLRSSGDLAYLKQNREAIEKAWSFETAATSDTDHDGIYDNSQGTGWVESWPPAMPHQEIYMALLDEQASNAYAAMEKAFGDEEKSATATTRAAKIKSLVESEYYDSAKSCYAFSKGMDSTQDKTSTVYPAIGYWDSGAGLAQPKNCLQQFAAPTLDTDWGTRDVSSTESIYDGMSYHQGSVWPLFTGWATLAEYRANQPLPGQQMLMQNVDLTWAQDPGAVTELLSGDFYIPMGRSTSHQLWSSAMVIIPTLRGLFGIDLDAATNTITVNPHLPADWSHAEVKNLHLGNQLIDLTFTRDKGLLRITSNAKGAALKLRSDEANANTRPSKGEQSAQLEIPLPAIEISLLNHALPTPGARPAQLKILSTEYGPRSLTIKAEGQPGTQSRLALQRNQPVTPKITTTTESKLEPSGPQHPQDQSLILNFPQGQGWQTTELTLTW